MAIRENSTVNVIGGPYKGRTGKVVRVHDLVSVVIVSFDDNGDLGKIHFSELVEIEPQKQAVEPEIPEGAKKISRADFEEALTESIVFLEEYQFRNPKSRAAGVTIAAIVGTNVADKIFKGQDVVVMSEDQFIVALWADCCPEAVSEIIGGGVPIGKAKDISVAAVASLAKISDILFGDEVGK